MHDAECMACLHMAAPCMRILRSCPLACAAPWVHKPAPYCNVMLAKHTCLIKQGELMPSNL